MNGLHLSPNSDENAGGRNQASDQDAGLLDSVPEPATKAGASATQGSERPANHPEGRGPDSVGGDDSTTGDWCDVSHWDLESFVYLEQLRDLAGDKATATLLRLLCSSVSKATARDPNREYVAVALISERRGAEDDESDAKYTEAVSSNS